MKRVLLKLSGFALCILPPSLAVISYFPIWIAEGGECVVSGVTVLLLMLSVLPLWRAISRLLASPAIYTLWLIAFLSFLMLSKIADEMTVISFFGFIGNALGALCFRLARGKEVKQDGTV